MPYCKLLRRLIADTNYTNAEIIRRCKEMGEPINPTYFSKFLNGKEEPPDEKKSRAIAQVLEIDERRLVIEGYIDKAPKEIKEVFKNMQLMENLSAIKFMELIDKSKLKELQEYFSKEPLSDMIIDILDNTENYISYLEEEMHIESIGDGEEIHMGLENPVGIEIKDNAMAPKINKGDKVTIKIIGNNFRGTDILLVKTKQNPEVRIRNVIRQNDTRILQGYSSEYIEICDKDDLTIIGKVNNVIKKID